MLPPSVSDDAQSGAEVRLFSLIRDQLPDSWSCLHSLGMTIHDRKPWAEIDFVLVGPSGVFCMEVKGGILSRRDGVWYTTPIHGPNEGVRQRLKESPFEQVGSASAALFGFVEKRFPKAREYLISCFCVATPDSEWSVYGADVERDLVFDYTDVAAGFENFMQRVVLWWTTRFDRRFGKLGPSPLSVIDRQAIIELLRGDFDLVPSLAVQSEMAEAEMLRLTAEQAEIFSKLDSNQRVLVQGGAGTGKTMIAVEEARRAESSGESVLFTCFSRNLAIHIATMFERSEFVTVSTLHALMRRIVDDAGRTAELPDAEESDVMEVFLPELCQSILIEDGLDGRYGRLIVDEGQDLLRTNLVDVLDLLLQGGIREGWWRIFYDPNQDLFGGIGGGVLAQLLAASPARWPLTVNCRNTAPIATRIALLTGAELAPTLKVDGPPTEILYWNTPEEEWALVSSKISVLVKGGIDPEQIAVLSPRRLERTCLARGLQGKRFELADVSRGGIGSAPGSVMFSTIASFKGLETRAVLLIDIAGLEEIEQLRDVYVGASRARVELIVLLPSSAEPAVMALAEESGRLQSTQL